ncbi:hypothetical protein FPV67DRAFT_1670198 [Lyophyllum atratum]|nr:hypothetical protein FPV67DRAFT_1670198 [Lyophyllum atratum]
MVAQRIKEWYSNNCKPHKVKPQALSLQFKSKAKRAPQAIEVYSRDYYKVKVQDGVKAEIADKGIIPKKTLPVIRRQLMEAFAAESPEVRQAVLAAVETAKTITKSPEAVEPTPQSYAAAIECIPNAVEQFVDAMRAQTGWVWSVIGGGPDPINHGSIRTLGFHQGKNDLGQSFRDSHATYDENIREPYGAYVQTLFSQEVCNSRALLPDPNTRKHEVQVPSSDTEPVSLFPEDPCRSHLPDAEPRLPKDFSMIDPTLRPDSISLSPPSPLSVPLSTAPTAQALPTLLQPLPVPPTTTTQPTPLSPSLPEEPPADIPLDFPFSRVMCADGTEYRFPDSLYSEPISTPSSPISIHCPISGTRMRSISPIADFENLAAGLAKRPLPVLPKAPAKSRAKVPKAPKTSPLPPVLEPADSVGRGKRVRKVAPSKEVTALTVDENGHPTTDANGNPIKSTAPGKRKANGKENSGPSKKPKA